MEVVSPTGRRTIAARDFFDGLWSTSMEPDELLVGVSFPIWSGRSGFAVEEFARRHGDFAIAGATIGIELDADDRIRRCAIGLIGLGLDARAGRQPPRPSSRAAPITDVEPEEVGRLAMAGLDVGPHRPARLRRVPHAGGRRHGGARVDARPRTEARHG